MHYQGSCHCGLLKFEAEGELEQVIECNCSHCSRKGFLLWFVPRAQMKITSGEGKSTVYKFNKHRIDHHFCPTCGCQTYGFAKDKDGNEMAAVNARCLENVDLSGVKKHQYDGKSA
ncbi:Glutathione-dependent formaldehyde-activating enzyme [compost metagenome]